MNKEATFTACKALCWKRKKATTIGNHTKAIYEKDGDTLILDYSPYGENVWDANIHTKGGSCHPIRCVMDLIRYVKQGA
jgi:hypothetical protein